MATLGPSQFVEDPACRPVYDALSGEFTWKANLGTCGITSETTPEGKILFHKTLCIDPDFVETGEYQLAVTGNFLKKQSIAIIRLHNTVE